ncbi:MULTISPECIES: ribonuclease HII [Oleiagrimonas]|uniref:Ribonuclease HII n=1 Tax=Oleiagrimonas citrea TaxID=1665687 RepID=A0A846ZJQ9_9GAMM|nr:MULTISPECIES: ribonuclease HII [Oleiagrimonas]NKZ37937.1 ribonuclease HII [Oleiagrimonas citrea]RAP57433.1 ribonuclease HII [Oleiagrimonas sp. MCCC 1A03011]
MPRRRPVSARLDRDLRIAGVDEAGRGPLAGPVVVAAVILDPARTIRGLDDSKQLSETRRETLYERIVERALAWRIVFVECPQIDRINIYQATMQGMREAACGLDPTAEYVLVDGNKVPPGLSCEAQAIVGGDGLEPSIGAASILAKVARDRHMQALDERYPGYGFARHKGYGVPEHLDALQRLGPCPEHRRSFAPVRKLLEPGLFDA